MRNHLPAFSMVLTVTLALAAGCGDRPRPPLTPRGDPYGRAQIDVADKWLDDRVAFGDPIPSREPVGNILYVTVPVRNESNGPIDMEYSARFYDENGRQLSASTWLPKRLQANAPDQIEVNSADGRAADFQIVFRRAR